MNRASTFALSLFHGVIAAVIHFLTGPAHSRQVRRPAPVPVRIRHSRKSPR